MVSRTTSKRRSKKGASGPCKKLEYGPDMHSRARRSFVNMKIDPLTCERVDKKTGSEGVKLIEEYVSAKGINEGCDKIITRRWRGTDTRLRAEYLCKTSWAPETSNAPIRIGVYSDLHLLLLRERDGNDKEIKKIIDGLATNVDIVALAGDIEQVVYPDSKDMVSRFGRGDPWSRVMGIIRRHFPSDVPILFVPGNHEFWSAHHHRRDGAVPPTMGQIEDHMKKACKRNGVVYLNNGDTFVYEDAVAIVGATMWVNIRPNNAHISSMRDFRNIRMGRGSVLTPKRYAAIHKEQKDDVKAALKGAKKKGLRTVVISHHPPILHPGCDKKMAKIKGEKSKREVEEIGMSQCSTDLEDVIRLADVWIYGHTHDTSAWRVGRTLLATNALGRYSDPNIHFDPAYRVIV